MISVEQASALVPDLRKLTPDQFAWVITLVEAMTLPVQTYSNPSSDLFKDDRIMGLFFLYLVTHHTLSVQAFKQEKFEYAPERIMRAAGRTAAPAGSRTNPGHDITVDGVNWSLKTAADKAIRPDPIQLTKWIELGKGHWTNKVSDLKLLCKRFLDHLQGYDRIFVLRYLTPGAVTEHEYEIIEIPKVILLRAEKGTFALSTRSKQTTSVPGTCSVSDASGVMYELYFDGGSERKLKLQKLRRSLCVHHATWKFQTPTPKEELSAGE